MHQPDAAAGGQPSHSLMEHRGARVHRCRLNAGRSFYELCEKPAIAISVNQSAMLPGCSVQA
jgi:hypothetical protein